MKIVVVAQRRSITFYTGWFKWAWLFAGAGAGRGRQTALFAFLSHNITFLSLLIPLCWQVCSEIWSLAAVPGEPVLLEWLVKRGTSLYLVEPDRQGTYVCVLGLVINTWTARLLLTPAEWRHYFSVRFCFFLFFLFFLGGGVNRDTSVSRPRTHQHQVRKHAQTGTPSRSEKEADGSFSTEGDKQNQIYSVWTDGIIRSVSTHTCRRTQRRSHKKNKLIQTQLSCGYDWPKQQYEADSG